MIIKRPSYSTKAIVLELHQIMREEVAKAVAHAMQETKVIAELVARTTAAEATQTALEAFQDEASGQDEPEELVSALKAAFHTPTPRDQSSTFARGRRSRVRLEEQQAEPGVLAMARTGNNFIPVRILAGPFSVNGKALYRVERLTKGKAFAGGTKPLSDLYVATEEEADSLNNSSLPPASRN